MVLDFENLKSKITDLISNSEKVTEFKDCFGGIYLLYVDDFSDDKIIPIYVGQTHNFWERYKQHCIDILKLNDLGPENYNDFLKKGEFTGKYKGCKLLSYLFKHKCNISQLKMVILEKVTNGQYQGIGEYSLFDFESISLVLDNREKYFYEELQSYIYGFNQFYSRSYCITKKIEQNFIVANSYFFKNNIKCVFNYFNLVKNDLNIFLKHNIDIGYLLFNYSVSLSSDLILAKDLCSFLYKKVYSIFCCEHKILKKWKFFSIEKL